MRLNTVLRRQIPDLDQRILAGCQQEPCMVIKSSSIQHLRRREDEVERGDLICVPTKLDKPNFSDEVPENNIRVPRAARKAHAGVIER